MRITGGLVRGRVLSGPKGLLIRPTSDRVREAIFNILGQDLTGFNVLDLFSGTGSLGLEALSRGASRAVFVDKLRQSVNLTKKNIDVCGFLRSVVILRKDLTKGFPWEHPSLSGKFDLIFLDPPYRKDLIPPLLSEISSEEKLSAGARVVVESDKKEDLPFSFTDLEMETLRYYGDTMITIYKYEAKQ